MNVSRRLAMSASALALGSMSLAANAQAPTQDTKASSKTFVLVHGAWHGGWCWKFVRNALQSKGHTVYTPTLTGLAERSHLLSTSITLQTHIDDIVNLFKWEELSDVVLVAHSYGGWPVSGALESIRSKVSAVVFVDAFLPENGQKVSDTNSGHFQQQLLDALARGEAGRPVPNVSNFGVKDAKLAAWVQAQMTPQPASVALQAIQLTGERERVARKTYVRASGFMQPRFDEYLARTKADATWNTVEMGSELTGHDIMIDAPAQLADILIRAEQ